MIHAAFSSSLPDTINYKAFENEILNKETPENIFEKKEESIYILNALKKLKHPQQEIMILRFYNELSFKEI